MKNTTAIMAAIALTAAAAGYLVAMLVAPADPQVTRLESINQRAMSQGQIGDVVGQSRPDFSLADASGTAVSVGDFDGQLLLINFWATWCAPCVEEMPMLSDLQGRYADRQFQVVGIALDDPDKAAAFAAELGLAYPVLFGRADAVLVGRDYGNRAGMLPYSVLIDRDGVIQWSHLGALVPEDLENRIVELL